MGNLCKKTTILFEPDDYERLKEVARLKRCSVGELIRTTLREQHLLPDAAGRQEAVRELAGLGLPVGAWEEMEEEILAGASE